MTAHTTGSLAQLLGAELVGRADLPIARLDHLDAAGPDALTFIRSSAYSDKWPACKAGAALVTRDVKVPGHDPDARALLLVDDADLALVKLLELFAPKPEPRPPGTHPSAVVDPSAVIGAGVHIGPGCIVGARTRLGDGCVLTANVTLESDVSIGRATVLHPGVVIGARCKIGQACILYGGVVVGADGFGYRPAPDGRGVVKVPHLGNVEIGDAVEIGANSCVDRAKFGSTVIGSGTKVDNLCQVAHNCIIGRACLLCGMCGMGGSVTVGDGVVIGGCVAIADNVTIGARAMIGGNSGVMGDVPAGETWWGFPAAPSRDTARFMVLIRNLPEMAARLRKLEAKAGIR